MYTRICFRIALASCVAAAACDDADDDATTTDVESDVAAASATLLVSGDFLAASKTKGIVTQEIATNPAVQLLAVGDMSYTSTYDDGYPWIGWRPRTFPVMGNHEFTCPPGESCGQYPFDLFNGNNAAANHTFPAITGDNGKPTFDFAYSYEVAPKWLLVVLNTGVNCLQQSCTQQATRMASWISSWRAANGGHGCVILALHTARWSTMFSGSNDNLPWADGVAPIWNAAIANKVDLVLQGHVHVYEEFVKLGANGTASASGAKLFTIGAGGRGQIQPPQGNIDKTLLVKSIPAHVDGVLKLALYPGSYGYLFEKAATTGTPASKIACNVK